MLRHFECDTVPIHTNEPLTFAKRDLFSHYGTQIVSNNDQTLKLKMYSIDDLYLHVDRNDDYDTLKIEAKICCSPPNRERERLHIT